MIINEQNDAERRALREVTDQPAAPDWLLQECRRYGLDRDPLTGMPVNAHVINFINELVVRIQDGSLDCLCVYYLDLDHFKLINDTHGHAQGDEIIIAVGNRAHNFATRRRGMAARLNSAGDEFCVVIPDLDKEDSILVGFELHGKMIGNYRETTTLDVAIGAFTISKGDPEFDILDAKDMLARADFACKQSKETRQDDGLATVHHFRAGDWQEALRQKELTAHLIESLPDRSFDLLYQPVVDLTGRSKSVVGFEVGVGAQYVKLNLENERELFRAEFCMAANQLAQWHQVGFRQFSVSLNLATSLLCQRDCLSFLGDVFANSPIPLSCVRIEILEEQRLPDMLDISSLISNIRQLGVQIWLDDFGVERSNLDRLVGLEIDGIKIDAKLIKHLEYESQRGSIGWRARLVVGGQIRMAQAMGLKVVAEGIENLPQLHILQDLGCDFGQGYLLGHPSPAVAVLQLH